ncbi:MAG: glycosyltransferase family 4 protein [Ardenticatenaceae bacterium]
MRQNVTHQPNHLMLFDLEIGGHHAGYIRHLLHYASRSCVRCSSKRDSVPFPTSLRPKEGCGYSASDNIEKISVVVSPEFLRKHLDVVNDTTSAANIEWVAISEAELNWYHLNLGSLAKRAWAEWRLFCDYAKNLRVNHALIMYVDRFQLPLALQLPAPCDLSGIYFRPTFHYNHFPSYQPSFGDRVRAWRQALLWRLACRHPRLKVLFSLDPLAVEPLQRLGRTKVVHLPDPVECYGQETASRTTNKLRDELGIESGRRVFLLFGMLDERKGIYQLLDAITHLPVSKLTQFSLLLVGPLAQADEPPIKAKMASISRSGAVQIILHNQFITDEQIQPYFKLADVILAPYQRHVGMSAILVRAAAAGKPLLASDYGLMGELVRKRSLGMTVDSTQASEIAKGVSAFLAGEPREMFDSESAAQFARENEAERFARVVWGNLVLDEDIGT